jgi:hypothetical protein
MCCIKIAAVTNLKRKSGIVESLPCLSRLSRRAVERAVEAKSNGHLRRYEGRFCNQSRLGSPHPDDYAEAESIRLELGVDVNTGRSGYKTRWVIMVPQVP